MTATAQDNSVHMKERLHIVKKPVKRTSAFAHIEDAVAAVRAGQMAIVVDDEDRENEGDRIATEGRGVLLYLEPRRARDWLGKQDSRLPAVGRRT